MNELLVVLIPAVLVIVAAMALPGIMLGMVVIGERQVGIVIKRFNQRGKGLPPGQLIATHGEAGYQADTLAPGWYFGYWPWKYHIRRVPVTEIPQGEIGLVVAADGKSTPPDRILGRVVECDNFQNARKFLENGGEKGRQLGILTAGTYRINTALFNVITTNNAQANGMTPAQLRVYSVEADMVGIVTTLDGAPLPDGEIAGLFMPGHDNFQDAQAFINTGGQRGLQEQILLSGTWNLNP